FAAVAIALSFPAFLFRLFHVNFIAHFVVILALALYFISIRTPRRVWPWFCALAWVSLWIFPYLFVIVLTIFLGTTAQLSLTRKESWKHAGAAVGVCVAGALGLMWVSGFFWRGARAAAWAIGTPQWYGQSSVNLLSPFVPQWSGLFPGVSARFGATAG